MSTLTDNTASGNNSLPARIRRRPSALDYFAIVGGVINLLVIGYIVVYWLIN